MLLNEKQPTLRELASILNDLCVEVEKVRLELELLRRGDTGNSPLPLPAELELRNLSKGLAELTESQIKPQ